jgi:hypothetical protein
MAREHAAELFDVAAVVELHKRYAGVLPWTMVWSFVVDATADLRRSVSLDVLPEMAMRLPEDRLEPVDATAGSVDHDETAPAPARSSAAE